MALERITNAINGLLEKARVPFIPISAAILACSVFRRPGMSPMMVAARVIRRQSEFGAPTGALPDGTPNMMNSLVYVLTEEIIREGRENGIVEGVIPRNSIVITGTGASAAGPVAFTGTNPFDIKVTSLGPR